MTSTNKPQWELLTCPEHGKQSHQLVRGEHPDAGYFETYYCEKCQKEDERLRTQRMEKVGRALRAVMSPDELIETLSRNHDPRGEPAG